MILYHIFGCNETAGQFVLCLFYETIFSTKNCILTVQDNQPRSRTKADEEGGKNGKAGCHSR
jgi:hypothetical protein